MSSSKGKKSYIKQQDFELGCIVFKQDPNEWKQYGSAPNSIRQELSDGIKAHEKMKQLSELIVSGFVKKNYNQNMHLLCESIMAQYFKPPLFSYVIQYYYYSPHENHSNYPCTPATTDEDGPQWPDDI